MNETPKPPAWISKRDGRLVPFESDKISRALFAAAEEVGPADAFLTRELADSVVFFLAAEASGQTPTTAQVAELVVKVVRELGHPALAAAFTAGQGRKPRGPTPQPRRESPTEDVVYSFAPATPLAEVLRACARRYGLAAVFSRDLAAVQNDGLLTLIQAESPLELAGRAWSPPTGGRALAEALDEARYSTSDLLAVDGLDDALEAEAGLARELALGLRATGLSAVINLNGAPHPSWVGDHASGPLFSLPRSPDSAAGRTARADLWLRTLLETPLIRDRVRIDWHLAEEDVQPDRRERLAAAAGWALDGAPLAFTFDRPRRPIALAEGLDREHEAVLLTVGLHLPRLLDATRGGDPELFLHRLGSLTRLALSAAVQKRDFLRRRRPELNHGFLLERARVVAAPLGLDAVVRRLTGHGLAEDAGALDLARRIVRRLRQVLDEDGAACRLTTCLDGVFAAVVDGERSADDVSGLSGWSPAVKVKNQLRAAGALHDGGGTAFVHLPADPQMTPEQAGDVLAWAWHRTDVVRVRFLMPASGLPGRPV